MQINITVDSPAITLRELERRSGIKMRKLQELCRTGKIPVLKRESENEAYLVNMTQWHIDASEGVA